jgi:hypothetical protein
VAGVRQIDIKATRCGRIVPDFAVAYVLRKVTLDKPLPGNARAGGAEQIITVPVTSNRLLNFSIPSNQNLAVDIYGYYVAAGTPVSPVFPAVSRSGAQPAASIMSAGHPARTEQTVSGTTGTLLTDAPFAGFGLGLTTSNPSYGWIGTQTATADASSGVAFSDSTGMKLFSARSDGAVQLLSRAFLDGRTDYFGSAGAYYGYVTIPTNIVHDVTLVDPLDAAGGNTNRVIFYNAQTDDENGSPATTKFRASTVNYISPQHINFDSQVYYHWGTFYHYRAFSSHENKDTFWVRAGTNYDALTSTTADMYVSGRVGVATTAPGLPLEVKASSAALPAGSGAAQSGNLRLSQANGTGVLDFGFGGTPTGGSWLQSTNSANLAINYDLLLNPNGGAVGIGVAAPSQTVRLDVNGHVTARNGFGFLSQNTAGLMIPVPQIDAANQMYVGSDNATGVNSLIVGSGQAMLFRVNSAERMRIDIGGNMGIGTAAPAAKLHVVGDARVTGNITVDGNINAKWQDVAEWTEVSEPMTAGTVVVVQADGGDVLAASSEPYDTKVAGVVSEQPGITLGTPGAGKAKVATTGRVRVRVDASRGAIRKGDLLVTSGRPGVAMRSEPVDIAGVRMHRPGTIIGKALEPLAAGKGEILVLLSLQ